MKRTKSSTALQTTIGEHLANSLLVCQRDENSAVPEDDKLQPKDYQDNQKHTINYSSKLTSNHRPRLVAVIEAESRDDSISRRPKKRRSPPCCCFCCPTRSPDFRIKIKMKKINRTEAATVNCPASEQHQFQRLASYSSHCRALKPMAINLICISMFLLLVLLLDRHQTTIIQRVSCHESANNNLAADDTSASQQQQKVRITIQPNDLIAIEGESAELNCDAEGEPEPTIEWYHNGQLISSSTQSRTTMGGSIQFLDLQSNTSRSSSARSDAGEYYCLAKNQFGEAKSRTATLQVAYIKEQFKSWPRDKLVAIGDSVIFDCIPQAWPEPKIRWRFNGRLISHQQQQESAKYLFNKIARTTPAVATQSSPFDAAFFAGGADMANGKNNSEQQQPLIDLFGSQLVIKAADKSDEGKYSCLVETLGSHRLIERESPVGQLTTAVRPFFIEAPEHRTAEVGGLVKLKCRMGGDPEPVISWRRQNGQPLSEKITIDPNDKTLILDGIRVADQGVYICEGENSVGSARAMAHVSVNSRPKFTVQPTDQEIDYGGRAQMKCSGEANPPPMLFWYKEGHRQLMFPSSTPSTNPMTKIGNTLTPTPWLPQAAALVANQDDYRTPYGSPSFAQTSDTSPSINNLFTMPFNHEQTSPVYSNNYFGTRIYVDNQGTLNVVNATTSDTGYYACAIISSVGSVLSKAKLTVKQPPNQTRASSDFNLQDPLHARSSSLTSVISGKYDLLPPPVIKMGSTNQTLPMNTNTTLYCDVVSQVAYKIQWLLDEKPLQEEPPRLTVLDSGALSINELRISDTGHYTCVVTAANEQNIPLANPFEPLDTSMLTSAPPIQLSIVHPSYLKVANPINPNIQFFRMDLYYYPSSPGPAYLVSTNGNDAITIAWTPPAEPGILPIKQYVVEHFDTSQESTGWRVIHRPNGKESLLIDGLSAEGSHFFVIRATNGHGTGPSSAIAGPMRTVAGENRYQLEIQKRRNPNGMGDFGDLRPDTNYAREKLMTISTSLLNLTPVSSSSVRLQWSTQTGGNISLLDSPTIVPSGLNEYLEGYSIRYRAIGLGESLLGKDPLINRHMSIQSNNPASLPLVTSFVDEGSEIMDRDQANGRRKREISNYIDFTQEFNEVRVADHNTEHYTLNGLRPFTKYQFFVVPYYKDIDGVPSNILSVQTNEDRPAVGPANLVIRPINNTTIRLLWLHIPAEFANGIILGYIIRMNQSDLLHGDLQANNLQPSSSSSSKVFNLQLKSLIMEPLTAFNPESKINPNFNANQQQFVAMYDITNLTYKSFYSIQVAGLTNAGAGPSSELLNFVMDYKILSDQSKFSGNDFDDVMLKSELTNQPKPYNPAMGSAQSRGFSSLYFVVPAISIIISILLIAGFLLYRRNNQKVITWKKTISEQFANKFYMPSAVDHHHHGTNSIPQNIYDHQQQQHLIYSAGSTHMAHQATPIQNMWTGGNNNPNNGATGGAGFLNSSGTGSLSSHGGLLPINNDPTGIRGLVGNDQVLLMNGGGNNNNNGKDTNARLIRGPNPIHGQLISQSSIDSSRVGSMGNHHQMLPPSHTNQQIVHHGGDYYSVINNVSEYEELDQQQRQRNQNNTASGTMQLISNSSDRHQTGSSNSDTSCPSSVTRLLPNQNYNRDVLNKGLADHQRHDMILQQQIGGCTGGDGGVKRPFMTIINGNEAAKFQTKPPLSPYATTNLMNQMSAQQQQTFVNSHQMNLIDQQQQARQHNFPLHQNAGGVVSTMDDSSKIFMAQQMSAAGGVQQHEHPVTTFRTLQRTPINFQQRGGAPLSTQVTLANHQQQMFVQSSGNAADSMHPTNGNYGSTPYRGNNLVANITSNPLADMKPNLYEHIDYSYMAQQQQQQQQQLAQQGNSNWQHQNSSDAPVSSSTSSGSVKSPVQQQSPDYHLNNNVQTKFRRGSGAQTLNSVENEVHDLRVFSHHNDKGRSLENQPMTGGGGIDLINNGDGAGGVGNNDDTLDVDLDEQVDESTALRRKSSNQSDSQRSRQLSKRKRQQQRNRLHNNNQKLA